MRLNSRIKRHQKITGSYWRSLTIYGWEFHQHKLFFGQDRCIIMVSHREMGPNVIQIPVLLFDNPHFLKDQWVFSHTFVAVWSSRTDNVFRRNWGICRYGVVRYLMSTFVRSSKINIGPVSGLSPFIQWLRANPLYAERTILLWLFTVASHFCFGIHITKRVYKLSVLPPRQLIFLFVTSPRFALNDAPHTSFKSWAQEQEPIILDYTR
jgi:hypothetical protein